MSRVQHNSESSRAPIKRFMFVNRRAPYGTLYALESLEAVLTASAFDQDVSLVFLDDGVYQLRAGQDTAGIGMKNFSKTYGALDDHGVEKIYVELESLQARGMSADDLVIPVKVVATGALLELMAQQDVVVSA
jgi:tRNA 2-thiouridine synthesizing protein C